MGRNMLVVLMALPTGRPNGMTCPTFCLGYVPAYYRMELFEIGIQVLILHLPHKSHILRRLVLVPAKVQGPVEDNPVKFPAEGLVKVLGIVAHPIDTDIDFPGHGLAGLGHVEGDDVCIVIVLQVGLIDFQQGLVGTKYIVHCNKALSLLPEQGSDKQLKPAALRQGETGIRKVKPDAGSNRLGRHFQKSQKTLGKRN